MKDILASELSGLKNKGLYRALRIISSSPEKEIIFEGKQYCNFSSNNYLGLAAHPQMKQSAKEAIEKYGCGGTSSRLVAGTLDLHVELEEKIAKFKQKESALIFPSGYQANVGIISTLFGEGDCIIMDRLNHASLWDAAKISKARVFVYAHRDMNALEKVLSRAKSYRRKVVVTDSVFSMDGDFAPLPEIVKLSKQHGALVFVDEAHATGIFGENGGGLCEHFAVEKEVDIVMGTLSKALGSQGAFVCAAKELIEYLINKSRAFIYTTALAPASTAASIKAIELIKNESWRRKTLIENSNKLRNALKKSGFDVVASESQIIPLMAGRVNTALELSKKLFENGIFAPAIRPPTVPENECRLRFSLTTEHTEEDIRKLEAALYV